MTTRRRPSDDGNGGTAGWFSRQFTAGSLVNLAVLLVAVVGAYFTTNATVAEHAKAIDRHEVRIATIETLVRAIEKAEQEQREKVRLEFLSRADKTAEGIAELNKKTAVTEVQLIAIKDELVKLGAQFQQFLTVVPKR